VETSSAAYATLNPTALDNFKNPLRLPGEEGAMGLLDASDLPARITAQKESVEIVPGKSTELLAYRAERDGKAYVNPTFRVYKGKEFSAEFVNDLDEEITVHWHGLHVDWRMDGTPSVLWLLGPPTVTRSRCKTGAERTGTTRTPTAAPPGRPTRDWPASS
jgi:FtsP/CotA-like multicopper oxidase with cupredoxin domain